jgi:tetratricopeptide (TPR) repeat protein
MVSMVGVVSTTSSTVFAQESVLAEAKGRSRGGPANADAAIAYGRALRRAGHDGEALTELRRAQTIASGPSSVVAALEIARTYIAKRDYAGAMNACSAMKKLSAGGAGASYVCTAEAQLLLKRGSEALASLSEFAKVGSSVGEVQYAAKLAEGRCRELDSKETEAEQRYREAIGLAPNRWEAYVLLGAMEERLGTGGHQDLEHAVELDPHDSGAQLELGRALFADPARHRDALAAFERSVAERPTDLEALRALTEAYVDANRLADAKRSAATILKLAPNDVAAHVVSGRVALADGNPDEAIREGNVALKLMPNEGQAKLLVADAYAKKGEIDLALEAYQKASGLDPMNPTPLVNAANACIAAHRLTSAKAFGARAVTDFPNSAQAWVADGDALLADGNPKAAKTAYENAKKAKGADIGSIDGKLSRIK